jgi:hypothetical protein
LQVVYAQAVRERDVGRKGEGVEEGEFVGVEAGEGGVVGWFGEVPGDVDGIGGLGGGEGGALGGGEVREVGEDEEDLARAEGVAGGFGGEEECGGCDVLQFTKVRMGTREESTRIINMRGSGDNDMY